MVFRIASSPYTHNQRQTSRIMLLVLLAAVPGIVVQTWFFGWGTVLQIVLAALTAWATEAAILKLRKQPVAATLKDNSALLTGLLLAVSIPPLAPWWMVVLGTAFAVVIAKQLYGGLGHNPFNPAMIGYVVLLISFPVQMTSWLPSYEIAAHIPAFSDALQMIFTGHTAAGGDMASLRLGIDGVSQATPLDTFKTSLHAGHSVQQVLQLPVYGGVLAGLGWQWVNIAWLAGGLFLLWQKAIRWHIPVSFLVSLGLCATLGWIFSPQSLASPQMHLLSGATMLGAFFILTDPVRESDMVVELMQKFMEAGFPQETAIRMMNSAMVLQGDCESYSTLDFMDLDLYSGQMTITKIGAAASFLKHKDRVECLRASTLPAGVDASCTGDVIHRKLTHGDFLVMVTDRKSTRLNSSHPSRSRMPSSA